MKTTGLQLRISATRDDLDLDEPIDNGSHLEFEDLVDCDVLWLQFLCHLTRDDAKDGIVLGLVHLSDILILVGLHGVQNDCGLLVKEGTRLDTQTMICPVTHHVGVNLSCTAK